MSQKPPKDDAQGEKATHSLALLAPQRSVLLRSIPLCVIATFSLVNEPLSRAARSGAEQSGVVCSRAEWSAVEQSAAECAGQVNE